MAGWAQKLSDKPTIAVGSVTLQCDVVDSFDRSGSVAADNLPLLHERMRGDFDFIAVRPALIASPAWPRRVCDGVAIQPYVQSALATLD